MPPGGTWLSYRREDAVPPAGLLVDMLRESLFAEESEGLDLAPGQDFGQAIRGAVSSCAVLVAVIGRQWATAADSSGHRRIDSPNDPVRLEIQTAFERGVPVVPVLVDGADLPRQQELPSELRKLAGLNAFVLNEDDESQKVPSNP